jgi:hypothetical protein
MTELIAGIVVAVAVLALVLEPLVRGRPWPVIAGVGSPDDGDVDFSAVEESGSPKIQALLALKEIEFDRETGKLSEDDYATMKATYQRTALAAIEREAKGADADRSPVAVCPTCGPRPESTAKYCSDCGGTLRIDDALAHCGGCGMRAPLGAKFCGECGTAL